MSAAPTVRRVAVTLTALGLAACSVAPARVGRPANAPAHVGDVVVTGRVENAAGGALAGRPVVVSRRASAGDLVTDLFVTAFSAGFLALSCVSSPEPALESCRTSGYTTTTDARGGYAERLRRADVRSVTGGVRSMVMTTGARPAPGEVSGPAVGVEFSPRFPRVHLPDVRLWRPDVRASGDASTFRLSYGAPPPAAASVLVALASSQGVDLTDDQPGRPEVVDARLLEDAVVQASVIARGEVAGHAVTWRAPVVTARGTAGPPPSRGSACGVTVAAATSTLPGCWLTDGRFASPSTSRRAVKAAVVDLPTSMPIGLVVVRAGASPTLPPAVRVEASADGRTWHELGEIESSALVGGHATAEVVVPRGESGRLLRVTPVDPSGDLRALTEVSVWPPLPQRPRSSSAGAPRRTKSDDRRLPIVVALLVLVVAVGAWGAAFRRGQRAR